MSYEELKTSSGESQIQQLKNWLKTTNTIPAFQEEQGHLFPSINQSIPSSSFLQITGHGKTEAIAHFLAQNTQLNACWIESNFSLYPCALWQKCVAPFRIIFIDAKDEWFWSTLQALQSEAFDIVILSTRLIKDSQLMKLYRSARQKQACLAWLAEAPSAFWGIHYRIHCQRNRKGDLILKNQSKKKIL